MIPLPLWAFFVIPLALVWVASSLRQMWRYRHVPGYWGMPLVGNLLDVQNKSWHGLHAEGVARFGPVFKLWVGADPHIVVGSAEGVRQVLSRAPHRYEFPSPLAGDDREMMRDGLLFARDATLHKALRTVWAPAFHPNSLAAYHGTMLSAADRLCEVLSLVADSGKSVEIWRLMGKLTMSVIGTCSFGIDLDSFQEELALAGRLPPPAAPGTSLGQSVVTAFWVMLDNTRPEKVGTWATLFMLVPQVFKEAVRTMARVIPDSHMFAMSGSLAALRNVVYKLMAAERQRGAAEGEGAKQQAAAGPDRAAGLQPGSFLKHLLTAEDKTFGSLSDKEIMANVFTFLGAGAETTANQIAFAIYLIATNPEAEAQLLKEVDSFGRGRTPTFSDLPSLPYLEAVFSEACRLMPAAPLLFRQLEEDLTVAGTNITLPKGTKLEVSLYSVMRDPAVWKEPLQFRPERFLPDQPEWNNTNPAGHVPFGGGPRMCIGYKFAINEAKLTLLRLYQRFTFELEAGQVPLKTQTGLTQGPASGIHIKVKTRPPA
eukprot:CAMPEP_0202905894 /NCGR_PEP_ID=MMETSP1392-20130828/36493_1 /ASSEMBLY_ACC=CAM_ASM_000868 /TAXON_ID=225041 /ORGANISM="Chlamydomonas chlamydogama, Strain SAG 11-48b" /LENGTH=540 /DNA_ID=CAMNT_0049594191 /DNA_START=120 /DNA_END=1742 /DNA_ORIENTATION=-